MTTVVPFRTATVVCAEFTLKVGEVTPAVIGIASA